MPKATGEQALRLEGRDLSPSLVVSCQTHERSAPNLSYGVIYSGPRRDRVTMYMTYGDRLRGGGGVADLCATLSVAQAQGYKIACRVVDCLWGTEDFPKEGEANLNLPPLDCPSARRGAKQTAWLARLTRTSV
jgi:hypothetical protein